MGMGMLKKEPKLIDRMFYWTRPHVNVEEGITKIMPSDMYSRYTK